MTATAHSAASASPRPALLCFGDSITANGTWVASPEAAGPWRLLNAGRAGRKTSDIPAEFPAALAAHPDAVGVLLLLGVNDLPARDPRPADEKIASCLANLQHALDLALARFPRNAIFLAAPANIDPASLNSVNLTKGYDITPPLLARLALGIEQLARANRVHFFSLHGTLGPDDFSDGLHPNATGDAVIARAVGRALSIPAFYLVGDSISIDYHDALELECLGRYRYSRKGGLELARTDLAAIADLVQAAGKRLIWVNTTPLDEQRHNTRSRHFHRFEADLAAYNAAAHDVMMTRGVPVIDLHGFTVSLPAPLFRDHVHFTRAVSARQATFLRTALDALLSP